MRESQTISGAHSHRKQTTPVKSRIALAAVATGAVTTAGASGAAFAHTDSGETINYRLAADETTAINPDLAPQIATVSNFQPSTDLGRQLQKAVEYSSALTEADTAARTPKPSVVKPTEGELTSTFSERWGTFHKGIDIANALGTPILAVMSGTVIDSGPASGYGNWIRIQHEDGSISIYGHMQTLDVAVGDHVIAGQKIAGMGSLGFSTGSHLHFEIHPDGATPVDPVAWLQERGVSL